MNQTATRANSGRRKILDNRGQIRQVFQLLQKHFDVLADALDGALENHDKNRSVAIQELASIHAILPYGEDSYHLNPHLRHYLKDYLNLYMAFETLTRISPLITQARLHWHELCHLQRHGEHRDAEQVEDSLDHTMTSLIHSNERNLTLLTSKVSSEYGNVSSLRAKIRENEQYRRQIIQLLKELISVEELLKLVNENPTERGDVVIRTRQMINARLSSRRGIWVSRLNDIQAVISKRLFLARKLERQLLALSQASLWLSRNPTLDGLDIDPAIDQAPDVLDALYRPIAIRVPPQTAFNDRNPHIEDALEKAVQRLPARPTAPTSDSDHGIQRVQALTNEVIEDEALVVDQLIHALVQHLYEQKTPSVSLRNWRCEQRQAEHIDDEVWVLYAANQLVLYEDIHLEFHIHPPMPAQFNDLLYDVTAHLLSA